MVKLIRIVFCGPVGVGKTSIIEECIHRNYASKGPEDFLPTIEDTYNAIVDTDKNTKERIRIYEIGGNTQVERHYVESCDAFVLVYDVNDSHSLAEVMELRRQLEELRGKRDVLFALCGNKVDLLKTQQQDLNDLNRWANTSKTHLFQTSVRNRPSIVSMITWVVSRVLQMQTKSGFPFGKRESKAFQA